MAEIRVYIHRAGSQLGPYSETEIATLLANGTLNKEDLAWREGCSGWVPLSELIVQLLPLPATQPVQKPAAESQHSDALGYAMLAVPTVAAVLIWQSVPLGLPSDAIPAVAVVITAILGGIEARQLGIGGNHDKTPKGRKRSGPSTWSAFILFLWIVGFPAYLSCRSRFGVRNLLLPAVVVTLAFMSAPFLAAQQLPSVDAPEVITTAENAIRESPAFKITGEIVGPITISNPGEISYDHGKQKRVARAELKTKLGTEVIYYTVEWQNRSKGLIWVQIQDHE